MNSYSVAIIREVPGLTELARAWEALWNRAAGATPFQSPLWLIPWWRAFAPGELFTMAVWRESRLVGLAPLYLETGPLGVRLLPLGISLSDYLDVLIDLGARVIKIERPDGGDFAREYDTAVKGLSSYFVWLNRSKESLTLDLRTPAGRECAAAALSP